jgi:hypothetical protein
MLYPEFGQYKSFVDPSNPLINAYRTDGGHVFYVEPGFYYALKAFKDKKTADFDRIMDRIAQIVATNPNVIFTGSYETPFFSKSGFVYREITDITDFLGIFMEDKSRPCDYGD